jgi:predicted DNA-binding transcriptional regulator YafY
MPANKNAMMRYKIIDSCLRNRLRRWTLQDLIDAVSDALKEQEGLERGISRRSIQLDMQLMRSDKLGYNAPIVVVEGKYYTYEDPKYSINNILSNSDLVRMREAIEVLKQFKSFSHFTSLNHIVQKLEDHVYAATHHSAAVITLERNERLRGLEHLDILYQCVINKRPLRMTYKSFRAREERAFAFHIWWLKEFRNRWFAIGVKDEKKAIFNLALDRIEKIELLDDILYIENEHIIPEEYHKDVIGVTVSENMRITWVKLFVSREHAPYIVTKPLHLSQTVIDEGEDGIVITLHVQLNFELEREILGFGDGMQVLAPAKLRKRILLKLNRSIYNYRVNNQDDNSQDDPEG